MTDPSRSARSGRRATARGDGPRVSDRDERRQRRAAGQERFDTLAAEHLGRPGVTSARMFGSDGLRHAGTFFAFVGADGGLTVKLPAATVFSLIAAGAGTPVHIGRNPAREWVDVLPPAHGDLRQWRDLLAEAYDFARHS